MAATSAMAEHFGFSYSNLHTVFDGVDSFSTTDQASTTGSLYRNQPPAGTAEFFTDTTVNALSVFGVSLDKWAVGPQSFLISMTISDITATSAVGSGSFSLTDIDGDAIGGVLNGTWVKAPLLNSAVFTGSMTNVNYTPAVAGNDAFDGHVGSVSMAFSDTNFGPWGGVLVQLTAPSGWFTDQFGDAQAFDVTGGSIDAVLPVPGAVLLGMLGLSAAAIRLRKRA